jgi:hypothetical protein
MNDRVELTIDSFDPLNGGVHELTSAQFSGTNQGGLGSCV